jgi:hypothetical protein
MLKKISSLGSILNQDEQKSIKAGRAVITEAGWCSSNCSVAGADCSEMFGPTKTCRSIPCDGDQVLACY